MEFSLRIVKEQKTAYVKSDNKIISSFSYDKNNFYLQCSIKASSCGSYSLEEDITEDIWHVVLDEKSRTAEFEYKGNVFMKIPYTLSRGVLS